MLDAMELNSAVLPCDKWTISPLKEYLRQRSVPQSGYAKNKLVKLVRNSLENPYLVQQVEPTDGDSVGVSRRTISVKGKHVIFPDLNVLSGWDDDLSRISHITSAC